VAGKFTLHRTGVTFQTFESFAAAESKAIDHAGGPMKFDPVWGDHAWEGQSAAGDYYTIRWHPHW
jgi:hypothetical protein